jgi:hypothetical protein
LNFFRIFRTAVLPAAIPMQMNKSGSSEVGQTVHGIDRDTTDSAGLSGFTRHSIRFPTG